MLPTTKRTKNCCKMESNEEDGIAVQLCYKVRVKGKENWK